MFFKRLLNNFSRVKVVDACNENLRKIHNRYYKHYKRNVFLIRFLPIMFIALLNLNIIIKVIVCGIWFVVSTIFFDHRVIVLFTPTIREWFGVPGSGKTSVAAWLTAHSLEARHNVVSNVEIKGAYKIENDELGVVDMSFNGDGCHLIWDEAGIDFDNRNFKAFSKTEKPRYFAMHRHMINRVDVFSQSIDVDKKIRDRVEQNGLFHLLPLGLKGFVMYRKIKKIIIINKEDKQVIDGFEYSGLPRICFTMPVWDSFNTFDMSICPQQQKVWEKW